MGLRRSSVRLRNIRPVKRLPMAGVALLLGRALAAQDAEAIAADRARLAEITRDTTMVVKPQSAGATDALLTPLLRRLPGLSNAQALVFVPEVRTTWNSSIPYSLNDGSMWAGRGFNVNITSGVGVIRSTGSVRFRLAVAPTLSYSQNLPFQIFANTTPGRSAHANPFYGPGNSMDYPLRFGDRHLLGVDPGLSAVEVATRRIKIGTTAENEWWGPGIRNALVMSSNARGIPRLYLSTTEPVRTRIGTLDAKLIAGTLTESMFFDPHSSNDYRALSGFLLQLNRAFNQPLTL